MKLKQIKGKTFNACLISNCTDIGNYIGTLNEELFETYKNCEITNIGSGMYNRFGTEIWINVTKRLQNKLCNNCGWENCYSNPKYTEPPLEFED